MKKSPLVIAVALFMFAGASANRVAQTPRPSATLDETLEIIRNKTTVEGNYVLWGGDAPARISFASLGGCQAQLVTNFYQSNNGGVTGDIVRTFSHSFSFADIDPQTIKKDKAGSIYDSTVEFFRIVPQTYKSQKKIEWRDTLDNRLKKAADITIIVRDSQTADTLVQALKHAARLCHDKLDVSRIVVPKT